MKDIKEFYTRHKTIEYGTEKTISKTNEQKELCEKVINSLNKVFS